MEGFLSNVGFPILSVEFLDSKVRFVSLDFCLYESKKVKLDYNFQVDFFKREEPLEIVTIYFLLRFGLANAIYDN